MLVVQAEVTRLGVALRLERDTVLTLQHALEETKQSWGASESEANTALATSHSYEVSLVTTVCLHRCMDREMIH